MAQSSPDEPAIPPGRCRLVVAQGELTGHAHVFAAGAVRMFRDMPSGRAFLLVTSESTDPLDRDAM